MCTCSFLFYSKSYNLLHHYFDTLMCQSAQWENFQVGFYVFFTISLSSLEHLFTFLQNKILWVHFTFSLPIPRFNNILKDTRFLNCRVMYEKQIGTRWAYHYWSVTCPRLLQWKKPENMCMSVPYTHASLFISVSIHICW